MSLMMSLFRVVVIIEAERFTHAGVSDPMFFAAAHAAAVKARKTHPEAIVEVVKVLVSL